MSNSTVSKVDTSSSSLRSYYLFWSGQQISSFGSSIVSFVIIWWITITTQSAIYLAIASATSFGTRMLIQFVSGYLTDFFDRKFILGTVDLLQALTTTILMLLFYLNTPSITLILLFLGMRGLFDGLHQPAKGAIIPTMVPEEKLQKVNSLSSTADSIINLSSPPIAAFLLILFSDSIWFVLSIDAITFIIAVIPLIMISIPRIDHSNPSQRLKDKVFGGLTYLRSSTGLLPLLFIFTVFNFFITPISMLTPLIIYSDRGFSSTEVMFALTIIVSNFGFLFVSLFLSKYTIEIPSTLGIIFGFGITITGLLLMGYGILMNYLFIYIVANFIIGCGLPVVNVFSSIIWQSQVPPELQGRIISVRIIFLTVSLPFVMIVSGLIADLINFALLFTGSAILFSLMIGLTWYFTDFRKIDKLEGMTIDKPPVGVIGD